MKHIGHAAVRRVVEQPHRKLAAQDPVRHVIEAGHGNLPAFHRLLESLAEVIGFRHLEVQTGVGRLGCAMRGAPVGDDETLKAKVFLQSLVEEIVVLAGVIAVHQVIGAHHSARIGPLEGNLEAEQIAFAHGPLAHLHIDERASAFLIVHGVVFEVADDVLLLERLHLGARHRAGQDRIFAVILEVAAVARLAGEVDTAAERHGVALVAQLAANERAVFAGQIDIPARSFRNGRRQRSGIAAEHR